MDSLRNGNPTRALTPRMGKPIGRSRPLTAHGLRRVTRERLVEPCGGRSGSDLQALFILELELECGLELSGGQGDWS
jgi:hypothetical protein